MLVCVLALVVWRQRWLLARARRRAERAEEARAAVLVDLARARAKLSRLLHPDDLGVPDWPALPAPPAPPAAWPVRADPDATQALPTVWREAGR
jgi:hypothetical protein